MKAIYILAGLVFAAAPALAADREPQINIIFSAENATCTAWSKSAGNKLVRQHIRNLGARLCVGLQLCDAGPPGQSRRVSERR